MHILSQPVSAYVEYKKTFDFSCLDRVYFICLFFLSCLSSPIQPSSLALRSYFCEELPRRPYLCSCS